MAIYKPSIPIQLPFGRTEEDFKKVFSEIDTAVAGGNIAKIVELSKVLYDYKALDVDPLIPTQTQAAINNVKYIEAAKRKAAENYETRTGKNFVPTTEEEVVVSEDEVNSFLNPDKEAAANIVKGIAKTLIPGASSALGINATIDSQGKGLDFAGYRKLKSNTFNQEPTFYAETDDSGKETGKYFLVTKFDKEGKPVVEEGNFTTYSASEKKLIQASWIKKQGLQQDATGKWGTTDKDGNFIPAEISADTAAAASEVEAAGVTDPAKALSTGNTELDALLGAAGAGVDATETAALEDTLNVVAPQLRNFATANGVTISDEDIKKYATDITAGTKTLEGVKQMYREAFVIPQYKAFEKQIKEGYDIADLAKPYITAMANTLELNPAEINLQDPTISKALAGVDANGQASYMPLWQFQENLRQDERYYFTQEATSNAIGIADAFATMFGKI